MSQRTTPPFRADMVGSLLRTAPLKQARAQFTKGEISVRLDICLYNCLSFLLP